MSEPREQGQHPDRRRRWVAAAALGALVIAAGAWLLTPSAVGGPGGLVTAPVEAGQTLWIGVDGGITRQLTVRSVEAVTDAEAQVVLCHRRAEQEMIGAVGGEDLSEYCERTTPVTAGTQLLPTPPRTRPDVYLLVGLTATQRGPQVYCGLDLRYRTGVRFGRAYPAGTQRAMLNPPADDAPEFDEVVELDERCSRGVRATNASNQDTGPVLEVTCDEDSIGVQPIEVTTHPDGIHLDVVALPDDGTQVELANHHESSPGIGPSVGYAGAGEGVIAGVAPGPVFVRCYPDAGERHFMSAAEDPQAVTIEVIDEDDNWVPVRDLECESDLEEHAHFDHAGPGEGRLEALVEHVSRDRRVDAGDVIEKAGYLDGTTRRLQVVRDDRVILTAFVSQRSGGWYLDSIRACA